MTTPTKNENGLPPDYIDPEHVGEDQELLEIFYRAANAEGGTADEIHLRGIRAVLARWGTPAAPPAPEPGEVGELAAMLTLISEGMSAMDQDESSWFVARAATLLQQQAAELAALRGVPVTVSGPEGEGL